MPNKKLLLIGAILFLLAISAGSFAVFKYAQYREKQKLVRQNAKAEELTIILIEGWDVKEIADYLDKQGIVRAADFISAEKKYAHPDQDILKTLPKDADLEGFLFPDTYRILKATADLSKTDPLAASNAILAKILQNTETKLSGLKTQNLSLPLPLTLYQLITLASIVEKETGRNVITTEQKQALLEERKIIAGIFYNRLKIGMPLESDATINYVTGKNNPQPSAIDLSIDSPYNTYKNQGLPKGPICNPSLSSIEAVLNPSQTDYLYFLHKQPSGEVVYSKTYQEHLANKQKFLK
jgi:UPF0755 protein